LQNHDSNIIYDKSEKLAHIFYEKRASSVYFFID